MHPFAHIWAFPLKSNHLLFAEILFENDGKDLIFLNIRSKAFFYNGDLDSSVCFPSSGEGNEAVWSRSLVLLYLHLHAWHDLIGQKHRYWQAYRDCERFFCDFQVKGSAPPLPPCLPSVYDTPLKHHIASWYYSNLNRTRLKPISPKTKSYLVHF